MFITPVSIKLNTQEEVSSISKLLVALGYILIGGTYKHDKYIITNYSKVLYYFATADQSILYANDRYHCEDNVDLFLALAAMTDEPNGIKGEWWRCVNPQQNTFFTSGRLYKQVKVRSDLTLTFYDDYDNLHVVTTSYSKFVKATKEEIIQHFNKKDMPQKILKDKKIIGYKVNPLFKVEDVAKLLKADISIWEENYKHEEFHTAYDSPPYRIALKYNLTSLFEPVYEEEVLSTFILQSTERQFELQVSTKGIYYSKDNAWLDVVQLKEIYQLVATTWVVGNSVKATYNFCISHINMGCKKHVPIEDFIRVMEAYFNLIK